MRRTLWQLKYPVYAACLARFFEVQPLPGETIATVYLWQSEALGKVLQGSYEALSNGPAVNSHPAIVLVTAYIVERMRTHA